MERAFPLLTNGENIKTWVNLGELGGESCHADGRRPHDLSLKEKCAGVPHTRHRGCEAAPQLDIGDVKGVPQLDID